MKETNELNKKQSKEQAKDPICGMTISKENALHTELDGKTYYFCGTKCQQRFISGAAAATHEEKSGGCCGS